MPDIDDPRDRRLSEITPAIEVDAAPDLSLSPINEILVDEREMATDLDVDRRPG